MLTKKLSNGEVIKILDEERTPCEVWSRVMGYYRPISEWNIGKRQEHEDRIFFAGNSIAGDFKNDNKIKS